MKYCTIILPLIISGLLTTHGLAQSMSNNKKPVSDLLYEIIMTDGVQDAITKYKSLRSSENHHYDMGEGQLNKLGYKLLNHTKYEAAIEIFKLNAQTYPDSYNVWDSLAEAYMRMGDYDRSAENYQKALKLLKEAEMPPGQKNFVKNNAELNLYRVSHFSPPSSEAFNYVSYFGGYKAGKWDMENISRFNQIHRNMSMSYTGNAVYLNPIPTNIDENFTGDLPIDAATGLISGDLIRFVEKDKIADVSHLWDENNWHDVFPKAFIKMSSYHGKQYFIPMAYQWNPVWYRKDIFKKHNLTPPDSWQELLGLCDKLNELGYTPFSISVQKWPPPIARWFSILNIRLNGTAFHDELMRGKTSYMDSKVRKVFEHWRTLFRHDAFADSSYHYNYRKGMQVFNRGEAVMYNLGAWIFEGLNDEQSAKLDYFTFPEMNPDVPRGEIVHTYGAFMMAGNRYPEESEALLTYLASKSSQTNNAKANDRIVASAQVDQSIYSPLQRRIVKELREVEEFVPLFEFYVPPEFGEEALKIFQAFWKNPEDIDTILSELEALRQECYEVN